MTTDIGNNELFLERHIAATPETVYRCWTERPKEWFTPRPWTTPVVEWDLRAGGRAYLKMRSPEGDEMPNEGTFLEVVPNEKIVFTDAFKGDWNPQGPFMVAIVTFEPDGEGTLYRARVRHWTTEARESHEQRGFHAGWAAATAQLAALAEGEAR